MTRPAGNGFSWAEDGGAFVATPVQSLVDLGYPPGSPAEPLTLNDGLRQLGLWTQYLASVSPESGRFVLDRIESADWDPSSGTPDGAALVLASSPRPFGLGGPNARGLYAGAGDLDLYAQQGEASVFGGGGAFFGGVGMVQLMSDGAGSEILIRADGDVLVSSRDGLSGGDLTLQSFGDIKVDGPVTTASGNLVIGAAASLNLTPAADLNLSPTGDIVATRPILGMAAQDRIALYALSSGNGDANVGTLSFLAGAACAYEAGATAPETLAEWTIGPLLAGELDGDTVTITRVQVRMPRVQLASGATLTFTLRRRALTGGLSTVTTLSVSGEKASVPETLDSGTISATVPRGSVLFVRLALTDGAIALPAFQEISGIEITYRRTRIA